MKIAMDRFGNSYLEWEESPGSYKRACVRHEMDPKKDWALCRRYLKLNSFMEGEESHPENSLEFPIFSSLPDNQILEAFVANVCAITSCIPIKWITDLDQGE